MKRRVFAPTVIFCWLIFAQLSLASAQEASSTAGEKTADQLLAEADYLVSVLVDTTRLAVGPDASVDDYQPADIQHASVSGFIIKAPDNQYYVITAAHMLPLGNNIIRILVNGQNDLTGSPFELVGYDRRFDTAVLRPAAPSFTFNGRLPTLSSSADLAVNERVVSLGRPHGLGYPFVASEGVVQELRYDTRPDGGQHTLSTIKHSCAISPGNSGGPLLNAQGEIVGMNVAAHLCFLDGQEISDRTFAIPITDIQSILPALIAGRRQD